VLFDVAPWERRLPAGFAFVASGFMFLGRGRAKQTTKIRSEQKSRFETRKIEDRDNNIENIDDE